MTVMLVLLHAIPDGSGGNMLVTLHGPCYSPPRRADGCHIPNVRLLVCCVCMPH